MCITHQWLTVKYVDGYRVWLCIRRPTSIVPGMVLLGASNCHGGHYRFAIAPAVPGTMHEREELVH